jgi:AcrR family transcriptional regulator
VGRVTTEVTRKTRSDALENRDHVVRVARAVFAAEGLAVTMREIARRAGLGIATLYRHFPTREDLITAAFANQVEECLATVAGALDDPDPWRGITTVLDEICARQAHDRGFNAVLLGSARTTTVFAAERATNARALAELSRRAHAKGLLRPDFTVADLGLVVSAISAVTGPTPERTLIEAHRLAGLLRQGMRATAAPEPLPPR